MPHGFFTIEQWKRPRGKTKAQWIPILHLDSCETLTGALKALEESAQSGLYRVLQTQRCIWAGMEGGKLRLHGSHASSPESLARLTRLYQKEGGRRPEEKAREERARVKRARRARGG
jgi:hypothetical protein